MSKSYVIQWKSSENGRAGKGSKLFELEEAEQLAEELNREYPRIHHEVVEANLDPEHSSEPEPRPRTQPEEAPVTSAAKNSDLVFSA